MNKKGVTADLMEKTLTWHTRMRALQLSEKIDPVYGAISHFYTFSHDQVPIELCPKTDNTIDTVGVDEVYDATAASSDSKRFCTLNLMNAMELRGDKANFTKPHIVFSGKYFADAFITFHTMQYFHKK